jgi:hypothetical protein
MSSLRSPDPSPSEIAAACERIRAGWDARTEAERAGALAARPAETVCYSAARRNGEPERLRPAPLPPER